MTCGAGTQLVGGMCVPTDGAAPGVPTISAITPTHAGASGNVLFTITGTGFAGPGISTPAVFFGDTANPFCQAEVGTVTETSISGEVPPACNISVTVTVTTELGMATTPFYYDVLFAGEGHDRAGDLFAVDPTNGLFFAVGPITDGTTNYGITALAFSSTGTLFAATDGSVNPRELLQIDPATAAVTVIGPLNDTAATPVNHDIAGMKFSGANLYAWSEANDHLVQIDPATGTVTVIGTGKGSYGSGLAVDGAGVIYHADGGGQGDFDTVDPTTGDSTNVGTMNYISSASVNGMDFWGTTLLASLNDGEASISGGAGIAPFATGDGQFVGTTLAAIDPATAAVTPLFELPAQPASDSRIDGIAVAPASLTLTISNLGGRTWNPAPVRSVAATGSGSRGCNASRQLAPLKGATKALTTFGRGALIATTCGGKILEVTAANRGAYALVRNHRGLAKLVDTRTGKTVLRDVASITAR